MEIKIVEIKGESWPMRFSWEDGRMKRLSAIEYADILLKFEQELRQQGKIK